MQHKSQRVVFFKPFPFFTPLKSRLKSFFSLFHSLAIAVKILLLLFLYNSLILNIGPNQPGYHQ